MSDQNDFMMFCEDLDKDVPSIFVQSFDCLIFFNKSKLLNTSATKYSSLKWNGWGDFCKISGFFNKKNKNRLLLG